MKVWIWIAFVSLVWMGFVLDAPIRKIPTTKEIEKDMVRIGPKLFMARYECTNEWYKRFLEYKSSNAEYRSLLPDTQSFRKYFPYSTFYSINKTYFANKAYDQYPVMAVSHDAAMEFCRWLTISYAAGKGKLGKKVVFSLPTKQEWMAAAIYAKDTIFPWKGAVLRGKNGVYNANFRCVNEEEGTLQDQNTHYSTNYGADGFIITAPVKSYNSNGRGMYQMSGNVSEMLESPGQHAGGGWDSPGFMLKLSAQDQYSGISGAHPCIGFRVVARVLE